ncbi:conserved hypothetical protein [Tenacibaculum sp. 190524A02b]|uniref:Lipoprotein n=1 Tax=Tenacibaculum vairaonense TaxID=3137860 RepID=A0ABP1FC74_9FLAO
MKYFIINKLLLVVTLISFGCNNCKETNTKVFKDKLPLFNKVVTILEKSEKQNLTVENLKDNLTKNEIKTLDELSFKNIELVNGISVLTFKQAYKKGFLSKTFNENMKSCNVYLFYSRDWAKRKEVTKYPQYIECSYEEKELNNNWIYIFQKWNCAD